MQIFLKYNYFFIHSYHSFLFSYISNNIDKQTFITNIRYETAVGYIKGSPLYLAISKPFGPYNKNDMEASTIAFTDYGFNNL